MKKKISVEDALIKGLEDARAFEKRRKVLRTKSRELPAPAPNFKSKDIRSLRLEILELTQEEFAQVLNVAVATVRSWEQGTRRPEMASKRLLQILQVQPGIIKHLIGA